MIDRLNPDGVPAPVGPYSHVTRIPAGSEIVAISGQVGEDAAGVLPDDLQGQLTNVIDNLQAILSSQGLTVADVFKVNIWLVEPVDIQAFRDLWRAFLGDRLPASTLCVVTRLVDPKMLVEIEAWAARTP